MKAAISNCWADPMEENYLELIARIEAKRLALGITSDDDAACRNSGLRRTPEKCQMLQDIADRCEAAGVKPLSANF